MSQFCTRCGAPLNENGRCPNCDASYSVEGIFDQPQGFGSSYGSGDTPDLAEEVDESSVSTAYDTGYSYVPSVQPESDDPSADQQVYDDPSAEESDYGYAPSEESDYGYAPAEKPGYGYAPAEEPGYGYMPSQQPDDVPSQVQGYGAAPSVNTAPQAPSAGASATRQKAAADIGGVLREWLDCAVSFFGSDPFEAADRVIKGGTSLWGIFAGLNVVFAAFCVTGMFGNGIQWLIEKVFGSYVVMLMNNSNAYTFGNMSGLFFFSLLMMAALFCGVVGCAYGLLSFNKKKPRIEKVIRIVTIAFFPMTVACAAAYIFSFFLIRLAGLLLLAGGIAGFRLLNELLRREYGDLPFWHVVLCNVAQLVAGFLCVTVALAVI